MTERVAALDGTLDVASAVGRGTSVRGRIPLFPQR
jgi:signal transduction histidine kinase